MCSFSTFCPCVQNKLKLQNNNNQSEPFNTERNLCSNIYALRTHVTKHSEIQDLLCFSNNLDKITLKAHWLRFYTFTNDWSNDYLIWGGVTEQYHHSQSYCAACSPSSGGYKVVWFKQQPDRLFSQRWTILQPVTLKRRRSFVQRERDRERAETWIDTGLIFDGWRALKEAKGLKLDA